jgi:hypothetical protein
VDRGKPDARKTRHLSLVGRESEAPGENAPSRGASRQAIIVLLGALALIALNVVLILWGD